MGHRLTYSVLSVDLEENRAMCRGSSLVSNRVIVLPETPAIIRLGHTSLHNPASVSTARVPVVGPGAVTEGSK